jgi:hypothetical protein
MEQLHRGDNVARFGGFMQWGSSRLGLIHCQIIH